MKAAKAQRMYQNVLRPRHGGVDRRRYCDSNKTRRPEETIIGLRGNFRLLKKWARPAFRGLWEWVAIVSIPTASIGVTAKEMERFEYVYGGNEFNRWRMPAYRMTFHVAATLESLGWQDVELLDFMVVSPSNGALVNMVCSPVANRALAQQERDFANMLSCADPSTKSGMRPEDFGSTWPDWSWPALPYAPENIAWYNPESENFIQWWKETYGEADDTSNVSLDEEMEESEEEEL